MNGDRYNSKDVNFPYPVVHKEVQLFLFLSKVVRADVFVNTARSTVGIS
jgi:hypothetical protein